MKMRAKLTIEQVTLNQFSDEVKFRALYSENKEDNSFADATPNAQASMTISNKTLLGQFRPGQQFYVDFTPIDAVQSNG